MRLPLSLPAVLLLLTAVTTPVEGQDRSWSVAALVEAGGLIPVRTLGRNVGIFPGLDQQQVVSDLENAGTVGFGAEVVLPERGLRFRALYGTTLDGTVSGRIGFCGDPGNPLVTGGVCAPVETDARVHSVSVDMSFLRGRPGARFRPVILLGLGVRKYEFGDPDCPPLDPVDPAGRTCLLLEDLWLDEGGLTPTLRFGVGLDIGLGPLALRTTAMDIVGRYPGGSEDADGHGQNDVVLTAGLAVKIF